MTVNSDPTITREQGLYVLRASIELPAPREKVFEFFADAFNLERLTPPFLNFHVKTPAPIEMTPGAIIDYRLSLHGVPFWWRTLIKEWNPPFSFTDEQLRGPYRKWIHRHEFHSKGDHTIATDEVRYTMWCAPIAHPLLVERDVRNIFAFREKTLAQIFPKS